MGSSKSAEDAKRRNSFDHDLPESARHAGWRDGEGEIGVILPGKQDLGKRVFHRDYKKSGPDVAGSWMEGRIDAIGKMLIVIEFNDGTRDLNRADLEWSVP
jgi:hypothetical protein